MFVIFAICSIVAVLSAAAVVFFKNPIHCALSLVVNLLMVACFFAMLDAHFLAAAQVIVYAGAIMVLVLFMLMLLNSKVEARTPQQVFYAIIAALFGFGFLAITAPFVQREMGALEKHAESIAGSSGVTVVGSVEAIGRILFVDYVFLFQAAGLLLMTALVGAVMLAKRTYR